MNPTPAPLKETIMNLNDVPRYRNLDCNYYNRCLKYAGDKNWQSFSCLKCDKFEKFKKAETFSII